MKPTLVIGSKNYSSWSLRAWLLSRKAGFEFDEHVIYFGTPGYQAQIASWSPSQRVPVLIDGDIRVWDSLAICEYVTERTGCGWPAAQAERALARAMAAEMHSGFAHLRNDCPMNVRARGRRVPLTPGLATDIARIDALWSDCRSRTDPVDGPWLFGAFGIVDAMFAPVALRFQTYGAALRASSQAYLATALEDPDLRAWQAAAADEGHPLPEVDGVPC